MQVNETAGTLKIGARVLAPPTLKYGPTSRQPHIVGLFAVVMGVILGYILRRRLVTVGGTCV